MHPSRYTVTGLYASVAQNKSFWGNGGGDRYLKLGGQQQDRIIDVPCTSLHEVALKLTELLEWMANNGNPSQVALLRSALHDLRNLDCPGSEPVPPDVEPPAPGPAPSPAPAYCDPNVKIDRRSRPVTVGGVHYPSIMAASRALNIPYHTLVR